MTTSKRPSMRAAINAMCRQCIYDPKGSGTWRQQVEACTTCRRSCGRKPVDRVANEFSTDPQQESRQ